MCRDQTRALLTFAALFAARCAHPSVAAPAAQQAQDLGRGTAPSLEVPARATPAESESLAPRGPPKMPSGEGPPAAAPPPIGEPVSPVIESRQSLELPAPVAACAPDLLAAAAEADRRLRILGTCDRENLGVLAAAIRALAACAGELKPAPWVFPVAGVGLESIGGQGLGFVRSAYLPCYATPFPGHPAHDIFVHDPKRLCRDHQGQPFAARAVEDGMVLVAREGWTPDNPGRGGNYVMLLLPARGLIAYYAHLETLAVRPGERVRAGQRLGTIGRTGKNAWPARSPTHLHFGLWNASTFVPVNSLWLLKAARASAPADAR